MLTSVVVESDRTAELFLSNTGRRGIVIPWGVEPFDGVLPDRQSRSIDLLGVGSLSPLKDFSTFVRVAAILHREGCIRRAVLLGDGPERAMLEAQIKAAGLQSVIECRGSVERARALAAMADARVLLHPSKYEGFGMVFAEAQSRGMSIVSRAVGFAAASPSWSVGESDADFVAACRAQLSPGFEPEEAHARVSVETAVQRYAALYRQVIEEFRGGTRAE
jgi:glycosyltransferase involved in cell wall biosynthesis